MLSFVGEYDGIVSVVGLDSLWWECWPL